jgi:crotonobetainyl-CoA:carnitine CoA-transferase CaiB-like acyl-CoA transferase
VTPVLTPAEAVVHEQASARGIVRRQGAVTEVGPLAQLSGHAMPSRPAPRAGQQTREVLAELGLSAGEIEDLIASRVVQEAR